MGREPTQPPHKINTATEFASLDCCVCRAVSVGIDKSDFLFLLLTAVCCDSICELQSLAFNKCRSLISF